MPTCTQWHLAHTCSRVHTCTHTDVHEHIVTCAHTDLHSHYIFFDVHAHTLVHTHIQMCMHTLLHTHEFTDVHALHDVHAHTRTLKSSKLAKSKIESKASSLAGETRSLAGETGGNCCQASTLTPVTAGVFALV